MMYREFEKKILIALYQEHMSYGQNDIVQFLDIVIKYGLEGRPGWLIESQKSLMMREYITGPSNTIEDSMACGKISAKGMIYVEDNYADKSGVGIVLPPVVAEEDLTKSIKSNVLRFSSDPAVPASDRLVSLSHNESIEIEKPINDFILEFEINNNGDPENIGFRERIIGQLKAGRELIRVGIFKAWLLEQTILTALGELIEKYRGAAIGVAASKLLEMMLEKALKGE